MKTYRALAIALLIPACVAVAAFGQTQCPTFQEASRAKLIDYVRKKYRAPASARLEIGDVSFVSSTCYRKLVFQSEGGAGAFRIELYASPDLRFLTKELLDSTVDPLVEERQKAEALAAGLTRGNLPARGKPDAPATIAVFSDFECPYCARFTAAMKELTPPEADKVRLVFHSFPLPMHPWARPAAEAARCAQAQGNSYFWALHDFMFEHQKELNRDNLLGRLSEVTKGLTGFDQGTFATCVVERKTTAEVDQEVAFAQQNGVNATPTAFFNGHRAHVTTPEQLRTLILEFSSETKASAIPAPDRETAACVEQ
jgi:protein-disulfide isomerase